MNELEFNHQQRERARMLFLKTGDKSHLLDMNYFEKKIEKLQRRPLDRMEWFVIGIMLLTIAAPFINYLFFRLRNGG